MDALGRKFYPSFYSSMGIPLSPLACESFKTNIFGYARTDRMETSILSVELRGRRFITPLGAAEPLPQKRPGRNRGRRPARGLRAQGIRKSAYLRLTDPCKGCPPDSLLAARGSRNSMAEPHEKPVMHIPTTSLARSDKSKPLDFVWLELTNRCNLKCLHCYAESGPRSGSSDVLSEADYLDLIEQIYGLGCRKLQFIGGEPTLNRSLPRLIEAAYFTGFEFIEVFTNLTRLPDELLATFSRFGVAVATSFYSHKPQTHDLITGQSGSFERTVRNLRRVLGAGLTLRVGIIRMEQNEHEFIEAWEFLERLGVKQIGSDRVRKIGRAASGNSCELGELCGSCAAEILSIGPDGVVSPCNMSKRWSVGSILETRLEEIATSPRLLELRREIREEVQKRTANEIKASCNPKNCVPYSSCCPTTQACYPCAPNGCTPCRPKG